MLNGVPEELKTMSKKDLKKGKAVDIIQKQFEKAMQETYEQTLLYKLGELSKSLSELHKEICDTLGITRLANWLVKKLDKQ